MSHDSLLPDQIHFHVAAWLLYTALPQASQALWLDFDCFDDLFGAVTLAQWAGGP